MCYVHLTAGLFPFKVDPSPKFHDQVAAPPLGSTTSFIVFDMIVGALLNSIGVQGQSAVYVKFL